MTVFAVGETIYDIIFEHGQPKAARVGGAMLNTAVSLGRSGVPVQMVTEVGDDRVGGIVLEFLGHNGVSTGCISPVEGFKTPVSLAFLDDQGNAQYSFYKNYPAGRLTVNWPEAGEGDILIFGSFYSLDPAVRRQMLPFIRRSGQNGAITIYDPNIRKNHLGEIRSLMPAVEENFTLADITRGSDEDFENLFGITDGEEVFAKIRSLGCRHVVRTRGSLGVEFFSGIIRLELPARKVDVVSTIGAGDSFNAGLIYGLTRAGMNRTTLAAMAETEWQGILQTGIDFASAVCASYDNYIPPGFIDHSGR